MKNSSVKNIMLGILGLACIIISSTWLSVFFSISNGSGAEAFATVMLILIQIAGLILCIKAYVCARKE